MKRFSVQGLTDLVFKEIWHPAYLTDRSLRGRFYAVLRVVSITLTGLKETRATSRAAALSFSTLLGLPPLIGLATMVAGFAVGGSEADVIATKISDLVRFVAPSVHQYEHGAVNPELVNLINNFIQGTRSSAGGIISVVSIIVVVLLLFTSVEEVFNDIWGVKRGRSWVLRLVLYWTILTLGAVLFFGIIGGLSAGGLESYFRDNLLFGPEIAQALSITLPLLSLVLVVAILTLFYRYVPNTHVFWRAALSGGGVVAVLLAANNMLAFFYISRIKFTQSVYGSLAMPLILLFGLYVFWLFILVGGQISYAVQNVHFRNSQAAWSNLTPATRERLTLAVLLTVARRFQACQPPCSASQLSGTIKVPTQILNESLTRLVSLGFVAMVPPSDEDSSPDYLYQPARPLNRTTLGQFRLKFENYGDNPAGDSLSRLDPILARYHQTMEDSVRQEIFTKPLDQLFAEYPFDTAATARAAEVVQQTKLA